MTYPSEGGFADLKQRAPRDRGRVTLDVNGQAVITFNNPITLDREPNLLLTPWITGSDAPVITNPITGSFEIDGNGDYIRVTIKGARLLALPSPLTLISQLVGFQVWSATDASGVLVDWIAT